jgi:hypothetical protein
VTARPDQSIHVVNTRLGMIVGRSLFPFSALLIIGGAVVWGPWVTLALAYGWWRLVGRIG